MNTTIKTNSIQMTARIAAILTLLIVVLAPFSMLYIPTTLIVPGDAAATASNIMASQGLFRAGMVSDAIDHIRARSIAGTRASISQCSRIRNPDLGIVLWSASFGI